MLYKKKTASQDFEKTQLPSTRLQSIKDILINRFFTLIKLGLVLWFFGLPLMIHLLLSNITIYEINLAYSLGNISQAYATDQIFKTFNTTNLILIPLLMWFGIGLSGAMHLIKLLVWQDPIFFIHDFKQGVKSNILYVSISLCFIGVSHFLLNYVIRGSYYFSDDVWSSLSIVSVIVLFVFSLLISYFVMTQNLLYQLPLRGIYKNGFMMALRFFIQTLVVMLVFTPWLLLLIPYDFGFILVFIFLFIVILPIEILVLVEYAFYIFDIVINQKHYPSIYRKGLWHHE